MAPAGAPSVVNDPTPGSGNPNSPSAATAAASDPTSPDYDIDSPDYDPTLDPTTDVYIPRSGTSDTGEEVQQDAEEAVTEQEEAEDGLFADLLNSFTHNGDVSSTYTEEMAAQARALAQGITTRQGPMMMCSNYLSNPHSQLKQMVTEQADPGGVGTTGDQWINAGNAMATFQEQVAAAINNSQADWQGSSGNAARRFMADVGAWVGTAGQSAQLAGTQTNLQGQALSTASSTMPEEIPFDVAAANAEIRNSADPWATYYEKVQEYQRSQEAHQRAAQVVSTYDANLSGASTMPAFAPPPQMAGAGGGSDGIDGSGSGVGGLGGGGMTGPNGGSGSGPGSGPGFGSGDGGPDGGGAPGTGGTPGPGGDTTIPPNPGGETDPSGNNPPGPPGLPNPTPPGPGSTGPGPGGIPPGGMPIGGFPPGGGFGNDAERGGSGRGGPFGSGKGGFGPGAGGAGSGFGKGGIGPGGGAAGALAAEQAAAGNRGGPAGAAGGRGAGLAGPMGLGAGRGQDGEDDEHHRPSYLVEADPDELFGTNELTAPPVIGE